MPRLRSQGEMLLRAGCGVLIPLLLCVPAFSACAEEASTNAMPRVAPTTHAALAGAAWRFRIGPLFEIGRSAEGVDVLAVRPLFSRVADTHAHESITDVVWPWSSFHRRDDYFHWWAFPAFGKDENVRDPLSRHTFWLLPVYCNGRTRAGDEFEALFPVGGTVRDIFLLDRVEFAFFPLYLHYSKGQQETESYLWPIYLHETGPQRERFRIFPVYGVNTTATERSTFAFWPFWTQQVFDGPKKHGHAEALFPVYSRVDTDQEHGWGVLPPFFEGITRTNGETSLRCPWPFYETGHKKESDKDNLWPLWTHTASPTGRRGTVAWPFWWEETSASGGRRETSETLVPFYHAARSEIRAGEGYVADLDYVRVWPFYSREETPAQTRIRVPELTFLRDGRGIERNWAPFWSWYVQREARGARDHDVLWGLARWGRQCDNSRYVQVGPLIAWRSPPAGRLEWKVLGGLIGRQGDGAAARTRWFWFWTAGDEENVGESRQ